MRDIRRLARCAAAVALGICLLDVRSGRSDIVNPPKPPYPPIYYEENFKKIKEALGDSTKNLEGQCFQGQRELLYKLVQLKKEHPDWFADYDFGPVSKENVGLIGFGHQGVAVYHKQAEGSEDYSESGLLKAISDSIIIDHTNYYSNITGKYKYRPWDDWRWGDFQGKGSVNTVEYYQGSDGTKFQYEDYFWTPDPDTGRIRYPDPEKMRPPWVAKPPPPVVDPPFKKTVEVPVLDSWDPNEKAGLTGSGPERYLSGRDPLRYTIFFENMAEATAPAQTVLVEDLLEGGAMNLDRLVLESVSFGGRQIVFAPGQSSVSQTIDLRPAQDIMLRITANLNRETGLLRWFFESLDPRTGSVTLDPHAGFLPPNANPPEGEGSVTFSVPLKVDLTDETEIVNFATIVFDVNPPIQTNAWVNVIDKSPPASWVSQLPAVSVTTKFLVEWAESGQGSSDVRGCVVYVSEDGGPYEPWLRYPRAEKAFFTGENGRTYSFYSVAEDEVGNIESVPGVADATTTVNAQVPPPGRRRVVRRGP